MIICRFRVEIQSDKVDEMQTAFEAVVAPSRKVAGVVSFDIGRDVSDPNAFIATEVFEDRDALDRQEQLPEVKRALEVLETAAAGAPEATIFHVESSEPYG